MNQDNFLKTNLKNSILFVLISLIVVVCAFKVMSAKIAFAVLLLIFFLPLLVQNKFVMLNLFLIGYPFLPDMVSIVGAFAIFLVYMADIYIYKREDFSVKSFYVPVLFAFIFMVINTVTSLEVMGSMRDLAMNFAGMCVFFAITVSVKTRDDLYKVMTSLAISAALTAFWGIVQFKFFGTVAREWVDADVANQISARAYSVFLNPNVFAEYIVLLTPIVVALFWANKDGFKKFVFLMIVALLLLSLLLTYSRGGLLSLGIAALVFLFFNYRPLIAVAIPLALFSINFLPESIQNRIFSIINIKDSSTSYRFKIWSITKDVIKDHPMTGVGFGHKPFKQVFETYIRSMPIYHAHNTYLQMMAEGGLTGILTFLFVVIASIVQTLRTIYNTTDKKIKTYACGILAAIIGILAHGMFEDILYIYRIIITIWIILALSTSTSYLQRHE